MRVAVAYENGEIFQHFGRTQAFKLYDIDNGRVVAMQVVDTQGSGHGALAGFLKGNDVDVLLCGGIGGGRPKCACSSRHRTVWWTVWIGRRCRIVPAGWYS